MTTPYILPEQPIGRRWQRGGKDDAAPGPHRVLPAPPSMPPAPRPATIPPPPILPPAVELARVNAELATLRAAAEDLRGAQAEIALLRALNAEQEHERLTQQRLALGGAERALELSAALEATRAQLVQERVERASAEAEASASLTDSEARRRELASAAADDQRAAAEALASLTQQLDSGESRRSAAVADLESERLSSAQIATELATLKAAYANANALLAEAGTAAELLRSEPQQALEGLTQHVERSDHLRSLAEAEAEQERARAIDLQSQLDETQRRASDQAHDFRLQMRAEQDEAVAEWIAQHDASREAARSLNAELIELRDRNAELEREIVDLRAQLTVALGQPMTGPPTDLESTQPASPKIPLQRSELKPLHDWQRDALADWQAADRVGVVQAVTGSGKSRVGVEAAIQALESGRKVLILVPTLVLQQQWHNLLGTAMPQLTVGLVNGDQKADFGRYELIVATVMSAANGKAPLPPGADGLLIADEVHRYGTETYSQALDKRYDWRLGLTATYERGDDGNDVYLAPYFGRVIHELGFGRALQDDVVAPYRVALVGVSFDEHDQAEYDEYDAAAKKARQDLLKLGVTPLPFAEFMKEVNDLARVANGSKSNRLAKRYLFNFARRRTLLAETNAKQQALIVLTEAVNTARGSLVFTQTKESARSAATLFAAHGAETSALYSDLDGEERALRLKQFDAGELDLLAAPRLLDEGVDVPEADLGIIVAASRSKRQMIQRIGRLIRRKDDGRPGRVVLLYVRGTVEDPMQGDGDDFLDCFLPYAQAVATISSSAEMLHLLPFLASREAGPRFDALEQRRQRLEAEARELTREAEADLVDDLDDWGDDAAADEAEPDLWELITPDGDHFAVDSAMEDDDFEAGSGPSRLIDTWAQR